MIRSVNGFCALNRSRLRPSLSALFGFVLAFVLAGTLAERSMGAGFVLKGDALSKYLVRVAAEAETWKRENTCSLDPHLDSVADMFQERLTKTEFEVRERLDLFRRDHGHLPPGWPEGMDSQIQSESAADHPLLAGFLRDFSRANRVPAGSGEKSATLEFDSDDRTASKSYPLLWSKSPESAFVLAKEIGQSFPERVKAFEQELQDVVRGNGGRGSEAGDALALKVRLREYRYFGSEKARFGLACSQLMRPPAELGANRTPAQAVHSGGLPKQSDPAVPGSAAPTKGIPVKNSAQGAP
jgi:hypothetical protein